MIRFYFLYLLWKHKTLGFSGCRMFARVCLYVCVCVSRITWTLWHSKYAWVRGEILLLSFNSFLSSRILLPSWTNKQTNRYYVFTIKVEKQTGDGWNISSSVSTARIKGKLYFRNYIRQEKSFLCSDIFRALKVKRSDI